MTETIKPKPVDRATAAFGASRIDDYLPAWDSIPDEFKQYNGTKWNKVFSDWFYCGLAKAEWKPKSGIETSTALAHIRACMASWEPGHEHKEAGVAYLLSLWFENVKYEARPLKLGL